MVTTQQTNEQVLGRLAEFDGRLSARHLGPVLLERPEEGNTVELDKTFDFRSMPDSDCKIEVAIEPAREQVSRLQRILLGIGTGDIEVLTDRCIEI